MLGTSPPIGDASVSRGTLRATMTIRRALRFHPLEILLLALGLAIPAAAQDSGPLPPAPAGSATQAAPAQSAPPETSAATPAAATNPAVVPPVVSTKPSAPAKIEIPSGTHIPVVLHNGISTRTSQPGD